MPKTKDTEKIETTEIKAPKTVPAAAAAKKPAPAKKEEEAVLEVPFIVEDAETDDGDDPESIGGKKKAEKYYEAVGRRKTAIARVRLYTRGDKVFLVNDKPFEKYFIGTEFKNIIEAPLVKMNCTDRFRITSPRGRPRWR